MRRLGVLFAIAACDSVELPEPVLCPVESPPRATVGTFEQDATFVAHAFGSPSGLTQEDHYSESREAFEASYFNGFRAYEIDLLVLADGTVAAVHDAYEKAYALGKPFRESTRADLEGKKWGGKYEVLFAEDIVQLLVEHPDVWLILDTKCPLVECDLHIARTMVELAPDDSVRDRIVPHMTSDDHAEMLEAIYPFPERMYARYQWPGDDSLVMNRMARHGIDNVMLGWQPPGIEWSEAFVAQLQAAGHHVWVHTPDKPEDIEAFVAQGTGVYTNGYITCE